MRNIINKHVVTRMILESLLSVKHLGQSSSTNVCVSFQHLDLKSPIQKKYANTFASWYEVVQPSKGKQRLIKRDRNILQKSITADKPRKDPPV